MCVLGRIKLLLYFSTQRQFKLSLTIEKTSIIRSGNVIINPVIDRVPLGFKLPPTGGAVGIVKHINFVVDSATPPIGENSKPKGTLSIIFYIVYARLISTLDYRVREPSI